VVLCVPNAAAAAAAVAAAVAAAGFVVDANDENKRRQ